ncbi:MULTISPECIES: ribonuclease III [Kytococcus]|uniref:Ribonuclease 3 n=1 Tax=Kytococcus schroeteri TaxID=138300 RepID=A0A2I1PBH8_9MICO|nr:MULTISPECIES: ribonuclease III [Kytococcus]OFS15159.1 ribonuclease III [Kytococcus sp. HMSC28H12]PKZ41989.1 ribonuclease III [Kytococcus schroeteri]
MSPAARPVSELADRLEEVVGARVDEDLLLRAVTHRSYSYENDDAPHNERLEFLGDSVLGLVVTNHLYRSNPDLPEGELAKLRSAVVSARALGGEAGRLELGSYFRLGRGEEGSGGRQKNSILADAVEAVIGAVYLSVGLEAATTVVHHLLDELMERSQTMGAALDWKTSLQELGSARGLGLPEYRITDSGPDHAKVFEATALLGGEPVGTGTGRTKKAAEMMAAEAAWEHLNPQGDAGEDGGAPAASSEVA